MDMENKVQEWLEQVEKDTNEVYTVFPVTMSYTTGKRYFKIIKENTGQSSVFAFIDKNTGDIYKPAGCSAPAKHVRGNVFTNPKCYSPYGINYLR